MTAKVIELNAPAYLVVAIDDALAMLRAGDKSAAVELLAEALEVAQRQVHWFQDMQDARVMLPEGLGWSEQLHALYPPKKPQKK